MKTIGMIGGMSWESSSLYYQLINREVRKRLGRMHSAKSLMYSFDFDEIDRLQTAGNWAEATDFMVTVGATLSRGGADFLMICCNTMHRMADAVQKAAGVSLLHIADPLGVRIRTDGLSRVGLLGSRFTMEQDGIIRGRLAHTYNVETIIPGETDRAAVHGVIVEELVRGKFTDSSRALYRGIMAKLVAKGAQGVILGCTEIPLLVKPGDATVPLYDTTALHAMAAVDMALG